MKVSKPVQQVVDVIRDLTHNLGRQPSQDEIQNEVLVRNNGERGCGNDTIVKAKRYLENQSTSYLTKNSEQMADFGRDVVTMLMNRLEAPQNATLEALKSYGDVSRKLETISSQIDSCDLDSMDEQQLRRMLVNIKLELEK